ncbi:hypothetical protein PF004_g13193 [Phytophthora fragariae]|uniref:Uncharacterized protein n=1 Tax=Phytophthora fragariae TaxID=53985 RepID=A0A6G0NSV5_9STRA|nr:hypothetical protein PF004_g13193 [Phytophthora fragariae]
MERLGYDPYKLIASAQLVQSEYDLGDIEAPDLEAVPQVDDPAAAIDKVMSALRDGGDIEDAETKGVSIEFLDELKTILECISPGKTYRLICLRCESS